MSIEVVEASLRVMANLGIRDIRLTGGEPTIHPKFREIVEMALSLGFSLGLVTNGVRVFSGHWDKDIIWKFSRCWVSVYGPSPTTNSLVGGRPEESLHKTIRRTGSLARQGHPVGLSVLICPGSIHQIDTLVGFVSAQGIRRLRFLPIQPDGRAKNSLLINWENWPAEIGEIAQALKLHRDAHKFENLSINDPFDLAEQFEQSSHSCLLQDRKMWAIVPNGDVYPCCFSVYSPTMCIGNILDVKTERALSKITSTERVRRDCHGLDRRFWNEISTRVITCPIRSVDPREL